MATSSPIATSTLSSVYWEVVHGTTSNADFNTTSGTLTLNAAGRSGQFDVPIKLSANYTGDKVFGVNLYTNSSKAVLLASSSNVTVKDTTPIPTAPPTAAPTAAPTTAPTAAPTQAPTDAPVATFTFQMKLLAADGAVDDRFGYSVSLSGEGNTCAVGAYLDDDRYDDSGSVYIYTRSGITWTQQTKLVPADGATDDYFGGSVSLSADGNVCAVGAFWDDDKGANSGSVYIYTRSGTTWTQQTKLLAADGAAGDLFGWSVSLSSDGNTCAVGAHTDDDKGTDSGSAYIYTFGGEGGDNLTVTSFAMSATTGDNSNYNLIFTGQTSVQITNPKIILVQNARNNFEGTSTVGGLYVEFTFSDLSSGNFSLAKTLQSSPSVMDWPIDVILKTGLNTLSTYRYNP